MKAAQVFTVMCEAAWPDDESFFGPAADHLGVRPSTVSDWSSGRRAFNPSVLDELDKLLKIRGTAIAGARGVLEQYKESMT